MPGELQVLSELESTIESAGFRGITSQELLDTLISLADIGAVYSIKSGESPTNDLTLSSGWNRLDFPGLTVRGAKGVIEGPNDATDPGLWIELRNRAEGDWKAVIYLRATVSLAGDYQVRLAEVADDGVTVSTTPYQDEIDGVTAGQELVFQIATSKTKNLVKQQRLQFEMRGQAGGQTAVVTPRTLQVEFSRVF